MGNLNFKINSEDNKARSGIIRLPHGNVNTPAFVPVATKATVKAMSSEDMEELDAEILMCNTYHLMLQPGINLIKKFKGLHDFMNWKKPLMTDSAGFQAFSLGYGMEHAVKKIYSYFPEKVEDNNVNANIKKLAHVDDNGVKFRSIYDNKIISLTPEKSIKIQEILGADIMIALDECTSLLSDYIYTKKSLERTHQWAERCINAHKTKQALFGVIQGGVYEDLRIKSSKFISSLDFDGFGIGGSLGRSKKDMHKILGWVIQDIPEEKPRHLLGIGTIEDLFKCVERGIDMFDCVGPTRIARAGYVYYHGNVKNKFRSKITNRKFESDKKPIDKKCNCKVCQNYSRAYIRHLFKAKEYLAYHLASYHNLHFLLELMEKIRESINDGKFSELKKKWLS